jgi:hypothetical protein
MGKKRGVKRVSKKMKNSKGYAQQRHAKTRCKQRFGFEPTNDMLKQWKNMIIKHKAKFVYKQSNRVTVWDLEYNGHELRVVYDKLRKTICTVLTRDMNGITEDFLSEDIYTT